MGNLKTNKAKAFFESKFGVAFLSLLIFGSVIINIAKLFGPIIVPDEVGYWSIGYYFTGTSWNGVVGVSCSYYGWGYGAVLGIISLLGVGSVAKYRIAIALNGLLLVAVYHIMRKVALALFKESSKLTVNLGTFFTVMLTSTVYYSQSTYCETLLLFLFWVIILLIYKISTNSKWWHFILLGIVTSYSYAVHNRMLILLVSVSVIIGILLLCKKTKLVHSLMYFAITAAGFVVVNMVKNHLTNTLFMNNSVAASTGVAERTGLLSQIFDIDFWRIMFTNTLGQLFYSNMSTFFIFSVGVVLIIKNIWGYIKKKSKNNGLYFFSIFAIITYLGMLAISVFSLATPGRLDHIAYGRYIDFTLTPLVLIGVINLGKISRKAKINMLAIWLVITIVVINMVNTTSYGALSPYAVPGVFLTQALNVFSSNVINLFVGSFIVAALVLLLSMSQKIRFSIFMLFLVVLNVGTAFYVAEPSLYAEQCDAQQYRVEFAEMNREYFENEDTYYLINDTTYVSWLRFKLKFHMPYMELYTVESEDFDTIPDGALVVIAAERDYYGHIEKQLEPIGYGNSEFELCRKVSNE